MNKDLEYFRLFTHKERAAAKAGNEYYCGVCGKIAFWSDIMNLEDHIPAMFFVCPDCKTKHQKTFDAKRRKLRETMS